MIKQLVILVAFMQIPAATAFGETKEGACRLMPRKGFEGGEFQVSVGTKIKGTCKFFIQDFLGKKIINAGISIQNTSDKPMHCQYYVAFFDDLGNLIGCAGQGTFDRTGLAAGKSTQLGSCLIPLPAGFHEKAVRYKIAFYESEKEIGKGAIVDAETNGHAEPTADARQRQSIAAERKWTDATGKHTVDAKLVEVKDGMVRLESRNGKIVDIPLEKLSGADQKFLKSKIDETGGASPAHPSKEADAGSVGPRSKQAKWYSAGPGWRELERVARSHKMALQSSNHGEKEYEAILSQSQPGSTIVLLFALDNSDKNIPDSYRDLLPIPWARIEAKLQKGETVEGSGRSRDREIILLAAPRESELKELIRKTKLLSPNPAGR